MKPINQNLFDGFHFDPGWFCFNPGIEDSDPLIGCVFIPAGIFKRIEFDAFKIRQMQKEAKTGKTVCCENNIQN